jgi:hypothetical protein
VSLSLYYRLGLIHSPFCLRFSLVVLIMTFLMSGLLYMTFHRNCRVTSYYIVTMLKQTTEVKTLLIAQVTSFHNSRPAMSQTVSHKEVRVRARIIPVGIRDAKMFAICMVFSWYFPFPCQ